MLYFTKGTKSRRRIELQLNQFQENIQTTYEYHVKLPSHLTHSCSVDAKVKELVCLPKQERDARKPCGIFVVFLFGISPVFSYLCNTYNNLLQTLKMKRLTIVTRFSQVTHCKPLTKSPKTLVSRRAASLFAAAAANKRGARCE